MTIDTIAAENGRVCIVVPDSQAVFTKETAVAVADMAGYSELLDVAIEELSETCTGVSLDPHTSLHLATEKSERSGLLLRLTTPISTDRYAQLPQLLPNWSPEHVANNYAVAHFELWYNPFEEHADKKKQLLAEMYEYCKQQGTQLVVTLRIFLLEGQSESFAELQLQAVRELQVSAHLLALEYPESALSAATMTAELDVPWIVLSDPSDTYDQFKDKLRICLESGGSGCLVERLLWTEIDIAQPEGEANPDKQLTAALPQLIHALKTTSRDRVIELNRISQEFAPDPEFAE